MFFLLPRSRAPDTVKIRDPDQPEVEVLTQPELLSIIKQVCKQMDERRVETNACLSYGITCVNRYMYAVF